MDLLLVHLLALALGVSPRVVAEGGREPRAVSTLLLTDGSPC